MQRAVIRSTIFNLAFYGITAIFAIAYLPLLILPRAWFTKAIEFWLRVVNTLEETILNLRYEIRGIEHIPKKAPFIIAAKHQSAYETLKLHLLFKDPAVILKRELLFIPLFGLYLAKNGSIAINRKNRDTALKSMTDGAKRVAAENRPIVIFPQGTRVNINATPKDKPYKSGIHRVQEATNLPIIPMALNTGLFWPRRGWFKSPGTVIFEFLPPIAPGKDKAALMKELEETLEPASAGLMNETRLKEMDKEPKPVLMILGILAILILIFGAYSVLWFETAKNVKTAYINFLTDIAEPRIPYTIPKISGYPGPLHAKVAKETIENENGSVTIIDISAQGWPVPGLPIDILTGPVIIRTPQWKKPLALHSISGKISYKNDVLNILESTITQGAFTGEIIGDINLKQKPVPAFNLVTRLKNQTDLLMTLAKSKIIEERMALFLGAGFAALADENGIVEVPITQHDQGLYAGPLRIFEIPTPAPDL